ncbi:MAG: hypothetical protein ACRD3A_11590 [Terriglobales bacterium]
MKFVVKTLRAALLLTLVSLLVSVSGWAQSSEEQQSLGDVARQEKAKKPKKVVTDEDLPQGTATSGSEATSQSSEGKKEEKSEGEAKEGEEKSAAQGEEGSMTKAEEADEAKKKLEALKADEGSYKRGISRFEEMIANEADESRRELYRNAMKHGQERLAENQKQQAEAEKEAAAKEAAAKEEEQPPQ